jgi:signal transduction histidine kinase
MHEPVLEFFERSPDALLLCQRQEAQPGPIYAVHSINQAARTLIGSNGQLTSLLPVDQVIPSRILLDSIEKAFATGVRQAGHTEPGSLANGSASLSFTVDKLATSILVQLSPLPVNNLHQALGEHLLSTNLTCVVIFEAVRNQGGDLTDLRLVYQNDAARQNPYLDTPAQIGLLITQWYPNSKTSGLFQRYSEVIETAIPFMSEKYYPDKDSNYHVAVSKHGDGVIISYYSQTEKIRAERHAKNQFQLLEGILNSSENIIFVIDAVQDSSGTIVDFRISQGNKNAMEAFRHAYGVDVTGMSIRELVGSKPELFDEAVQIMETGVPLVLEQRYEPSSDKWYKVSIHKLYNGLVMTYVDITPVQTALIEAQHQAELVQAVLDSSINGLYAMEPLLDEVGKIMDFRILMVNRAGLMLSDPSYEELVGNTYLALFPIVKEMGLFDQFVQAVEERTHFRTEVGFPLPGGQSMRWFDLYLNQSGNSMVILTFIDTTERVLLRQKQESLLEKLRKSNEDLERFAYIASHDLSEPTRKLNAFSEMLVTQYASALPPGGIDLVGRMQSASVRMQELVDGILTFSRFSNQAEEHQVIPLNPVVANVLIDLETAIEEKNAVIEVREMPRVRGNQTQLRQLFQNLISNALKFTVQSTAPRIRIEAGPATPPEINDTVHANNHRWLAIRVHDNGIGFDVSQRNRVFELFTRLHGRSQYPGSGLGLAICKRVAELHGGGITVESTPGKGTSFVVVLPALE